jgi:branched-chain amino acid transport system permease protein
MTAMTLDASAQPRRLPQWPVVPAILIVAYGIIPAIGTSYLFEAILLPFLALSLAALGLNILTGYAGQVSLGSAAFMAVGAFAAYNFNLRVPGLPLIVSLILAGTTAAAFGILFGLPSLRLRGFYLAASTLAAQFFVTWVLTRFGWLSNYNSSGVIDAPPLTLFGLHFEGPLGRYLFALTIVVAVTAFAARLVATVRGASSSPSGTTRLPPRFSTSRSSAPSFSPSAYRPSSSASPASYGRLPIFVRSSRTASISIVPSRSSSSSSLAAWRRSAAPFSARP